MPVLTEPDEALAPDHRPAGVLLAVQLVGLFVADQEIDELWPTVIDAGDGGPIVTTGLGGTLTVSWPGDTALVVLPPVLEHVRLKL